MVYLQNGRNLRPILSADTHYAADKSDSQKREVTHKETQRTSPWLAQWKRPEQSESAGQGPAAAAKPTSAARRPWKPRAFSLPSLLSCPPSSRGGRFSLQQMCHCRPLLARSNLFLHQETPVSLDQTRGTRQEPATFLRVGVQPGAAMLREPAYCWGRNQPLGVRGSAGPSAPSQDSERLSLGLLLSTPTGDCAGPAVPPLWH